MTGTLEGKVALVTGGARDIGRGTPLLLGREGARVAVADVSVEGVNEAVELIGAAGCEAIPIVADINKPADVAAMISTVIQTYGQLDCAFNNAGINGAHQGQSTACIAGG